MAITFVNKGTFDSGNAAIAPGIPASMAAGDIMFLAVETANEFLSSTPVGWNTMEASPQSTGTAATAGGVRLTMFYRWWQSGDAAPSIPDSGNHNTGIIVGFRGVHPTYPFDTNPVGSVQASAATNWTAPTVTTVSSNTMMVYFVANDRDIASTTNITAHANSGLSGLTLAHDQTVATGVGGGLAIVYGTRAASGLVTNTTLTNAASNTAAFITIALRDANSGVAVGTSNGVGRAYGFKDSNIYVIRPAWDISINDYYGITDLFKLAQDVGEVTLNETDYIYTGSFTGTCEMALSPMPTPGGSKTVKISVYLFAEDLDAPPAINFGLYQGTTLIADFSINPSVVENTLYEYTLTAPQASNITNYGDLRIRLVNS